MAVQLCKHTLPQITHTHTQSARKETEFVVMCDLVISAGPEKREGPAWEDLEQRAAIMLSGSETPRDWATDNRECKEPDTAGRGKPHCLPWREEEAESSCTVHWRLDTGYRLRTEGRWWCCGCLGGRIS